MTRPLWTSAHLAAGRELDHLYRCDSMPVGRAYWWRSDEGEEGADLYVRADGSTDGFSWNFHGDHTYSADETWVDLGPMPRINGAPDLVALAALLA